MATQVVNLKMTRGDSMRIGLSVTGLEDTPDEVIFSIKKNYGATAYITQKTLSNGVELESSEDDTYVYGIQIEPEDTQSLTASLYVYDVEVTYDTDRKTLVVGELNLIPDVTRH